MDARRVAEGLDNLNISGNEMQGVTYLEFWLNEAINERDENSELTILSEMLGQYRRCNLKEKGLDTSEKAIEKVHKLHLEDTATGATILVNAATTMKAFGEAEKAMPIFERCEAVYMNTLEKNDYRMGALYNNMAMGYEDLKEYEKAEKCLLKALSELEELDNTGCDRAVTCCSLAELADMSGKGEDAANEYMEKAWELLSDAKKDPYLSFTIGKCLGAFDYFGMFLYAKRLREIKDEIDELYK